MISARAHGDAERHAGSNALGHADDVRLHAGVLDGPPLAGAADAALDFVGDQQNAVLVADAAQLLHEDRGSDHVSAFALDGLNEDGGDFLRRQNRLEEFVFDEARTSECERFGILRAAFAAAINIGITNMSDARNQRGEAPPLLRLGSGQRERAHGASVERAEERDDVLPLGVVAGQLHARTSTASAPELP